MPDLSPYYRDPPALLDWNDFHCETCREPFEDCDCNSLPLFEDVAETHPIRSPK